MPVFPAAYTGTPFCTPVELGSRLQITLASNDVTGLLLCQLASDAVREDLRLTVDHVDAETITLYGDGGDLLLLPERPVTGVTSVTLAGQTLVPAVVDATSSVLMYDWRPDGRMYRIVYGGSFYASELTYPWPAGVPVQIVYSHGYTTAPSACKSIALELAAAAYVNPEMHNQERVGWVEWTTGHPDLTLTASQRTRLDPYRRLDV